MSVVAWHDDDWQSEVLDDDGNYYRDDSEHHLPDTVNRGAAGQRLNMQHGFVRHIQQLQRGRQTYEEANPSNDIQQRYISPAERPQHWKAEQEATVSALTEAQRESLTNSSRYVPPHLRSKASPARKAEPSASQGSPTRSAKGTPANKCSQQQPTSALVNQQQVACSPNEVVQHADLSQHGNTDATPQGVGPPAEPGSPVYDSFAAPTEAAPESDHTESAAAREKRQRRFRHGFAAYTVPALQDRLGHEVLSGAGTSPVVSEPRPAHGPASANQVQPGPLPASTLADQPAKIAHLLANGASDGDLPPGFSKASPAPAAAGPKPHVHKQLAADQPPGFATPAAKEPLQAMASNMQQPRAQFQQTPTAAQASLPHHARADHSQHAVANTQKAAPMPAVPIEPSPAPIALQGDLPPGFAALSRISHVQAAPRLLPLQLATPVQPTASKLPATVQRAGKSSAKTVALAQQPQVDSRLAQQSGPLTANAPATVQQHEKSPAAASQQADLPPGFASSAMASTPSEAPAFAHKDQPPGFPASAQVSRATINASAHSARSSMSAPAPPHAAQSPSIGANVSPALKQTSTSLAAAKPRGSQPAKQQASASHIGFASDRETSTSMQPATLPAGRQASGSKATSANQQHASGKASLAARRSAAGPLRNAVSTVKQDADADLPPGFAASEQPQPSTAAAVLVAPLAAVSAAPAMLARVADQTKASLLKHIGMKQPPSPASAVASPTAATTPAASDNDRPPGFFATAAAAVTRAFAPAADSPDRPPGFRDAPQRQASSDRGSQQQPPAHQGPKATLPQAQAVQRPAASQACASQPTFSSNSDQPVMNQPDMQGQPEHELFQSAGSEPDKVATQHMQPNNSRRRRQAMSSTASHFDDAEQQDMYLPNWHDPHREQLQATAEHTELHLHDSAQTAQISSGPQPQPAEHLSAQLLAKTVHSPHSTAGYMSTDEAQSAYQRRRAEIQRQMRQISQAEQELLSEQQMLDQSYLAAIHAPQHSVHACNQQHTASQPSPQYSMQYKGSPAVANDAFQHPHSLGSTHHNGYGQGLHQYTHDQQPGLGHRYASSPQMGEHYAQQTQPAPAHEFSRSMLQTDHQTHPSGQYTAYAPAQRQTQPHPHALSSSARSYMPQHAQRLGSLPDSLHGSGPHAQRPHPLSLVHHQPSPLHLYQSDTAYEAGSQPSSASHQFSPTISQHPNSYPHLHSDAYPTDAQFHQQQQHIHYDQYSPNAYEYHASQLTQETVPTRDMGYLPAATDLPSSQVAGQQLLQPRYAITQSQPYQQAEPRTRPSHHRQSQHTYERRIPTTGHPSEQTHQHVYTAALDDSEYQHQMYMLQQRHKARHNSPHAHPDTQYAANGQTHPSQGPTTSLQGRMINEDAAQHPKSVQGYYSGGDLGAALNDDVSGADVYDHLPGGRRKLAEVNSAFMHNGLHR